MALVGGVGDIDMAGRGMDGGMVEAAVAGVSGRATWPMSVRGRVMWRPGSKVGVERKVSDSTLPTATKPAK